MPSEKRFLGNISGLLRSALLIACLTWPTVARSAGDDDIRALETEVQNLKERLSEMEILKSRLREVEQRLTEIRTTQQEVVQTQQKILNESGYQDTLETEFPKIVEAVKRTASFEFHGYFRAGVGQNSKGGNQVCFQNPGAPAKFRLGNECEDYAELRFDQRVYGFGKPETAPYFDVKSRLAFTAGWLLSYQKTDLFVPELYVEGGNLAGGFLEGAKFWAGKRFYRRPQVHIDDFYFWDTSGPGTGVEEIDLGKGKLAIAYFRTANLKSDIFATPAYNPDGTPQVVDGRPVLRTVQGQSYLENNDVVSKQEFRWYQIPVAENQRLALGLELRELAGGEGNNRGSFGLMANAMHTYQLWGGFNQLILQYGQGLASTLGNSSDYDASAEARTYRVIDQVLIQPGKDFSGEAVMLYQNATGPQQGAGQWISFGMRPIYNISEHFRLAFEAGEDFFLPRDGSTRRLTKLTLAPEFSAGRKFFDRPVLRLFVTFAEWNQAAADNGVVLSGSGRSPFTDQHYGLTYGVQAEAWW